MGKYAELLRENGASEEDIKVLATPLAERLHEVQLAKEQAAIAEIAKREQITKDYEARVDSWYHENDNKLKQVQNRAIASEAGSEAVLL
jgi:hypothetical protein